MPQWPSNHDFLYPATVGAFLLSTLDSRSDEVVVPVESKLEALIVYPLAEAIAAAGGDGMDLQLALNLEGVPSGPLYHLDEGLAADRGHLLRPTTVLEFALQPGDIIEMNSDGLQIAATFSVLVYVLKPL